MPLKRIITLAFYLLVLIWAGVGFSYLFSADLSGTAASWVTNEKLQKGTGIVMNLSYVLTIIMLLAMVVSAVVNYIQNIQALKRTLIGVGVLLVVFLIGYSLAGNEITANYEKLGITDPGTSKLIGGILNATYILVIVAVVAYIYSSINSLLKQL